MVCLRGNCHGEGSGATDDEIGRKFFSAVDFMGKVMISVQWVYSISDDE